MRLSDEMEKQSDSYYISAVQAGDTESFAPLVERYSDMLYALLCRLLQDEEDAADLLQDTFVKAFRHISRFDGRSSFSTWIYRIAYNEAIDHLRRRKAYVTDRVEELPDVPDEDLEPSGEDPELLQQALDSLPAADKALLLMFYSDDLSVRDIAEVTGMTESNVKVKLHRLRAKLYKMMRK
ncbi:ECF RNA polymerase sigma factor RpoE [Porphyromonas gingivalis]|uniref:ECF RNA polymerase sigma factor RpoE n=1 Tax=Porphyromonas gingivalis TaxID=837 RepID=UPI001E3C5A65|nr:sigma-70 family RNA polymerase sigma factor [Porphyromonas gingivalis]